MSKKASTKRTPAAKPETATEATTAAEKVSRREQLRLQREAELKAAQRKRRLTIGLGIVGVIVCYVKKNDAAGTWVASHFTWLIRTFWWSLLWAVIGWLVLFTLGLVLIGIPIAIAIWFVAGLWVIYRVVRGYLLFKESQAIPGV
jgi:uncharacterized membrane protein